MGHKELDWGGTLELPPGLPTFPMPGFLAADLGPDQRPGLGLGLSARKMLDVAGYFLGSCMDASLGRVPQELLSISPIAQRPRL